MMADVPTRKPMALGYEQQHSPTAYNHSRSRTTSSNTFPTIVYPQQQQYPPNMQVHSYTSRRTPSTGTFSTVASGGNGPAPFRQSSQSQSADLRRSTSSRSGGGSPLSYVALMRKQKATVWCDRSQHEDPRIQAAQRAAKMRANMEVIGGPGPGRTSTSGSGSMVGRTAKLKHHKPGVIGYSPGDLVGGVGGVPMRLSASEVEGGDSDDDADSSRAPQQVHHRRTGSGRSSIGSGSARRGLTYSRQSGASSIGKWGSGNSPPDSLTDLIEAGETPVPGNYQKSLDYFGVEGTGDGARSAGSGSSGERADNVGELAPADAARLASNSLLQSTVTREKSLRNPEDLRRRGSVDERTATMSHGRLYIANPDTDSD